MPIPSDMSVEARHTHGVVDRPKPERGLKVAVVPPKPWGRFWWVGGFALGFRDNRVEHDEAWIVVRNRRGDEHRLFWSAPTEAEEKRARVERELAEMPLKEWCALYSVPEEFARS